MIKPRFEFPLVLLETETERDERKKERKTLRWVIRWVTLGDVGSIGFYELCQ